MMEREPEGSDISNQPNRENDWVSRRKFLRCAGQGTVALSGALLFGEMGGCIVVQRHVHQAKPVGKVLRIPADKLAILQKPSDVLEVRVDNQQDPILIRRWQDSYIALSSTCTHRGCEVESHPNAYECPCHGSRFDLQGQVQAGPATRNLEQFRLHKTAQGWEIHL